MRSYLDCIPCFMNQALKAARAVSNDELLQRRVLDSVAGMIPTLSLDVKPPEIAQRCYRLVSEISGESDPFHKAKEEATRTALELYPRLKEMVAAAPDPLLAACRLAIAGNAIDLGPELACGSMEEVVESAAGLPLAIDDYGIFADSIRKSHKVLYLGDNAGETVFDRVLIEELRKNGDLEIAYVVRGRPVINDATIEEAVAAGIDGVAEIISNGSDAPATVLEQCSAEMLERYRSADVIIAKGQGNYESLNEEPDNIFFLLKAKCRVIASFLQVNIGDIVLKHSRA